MSSKENYFKSWRFHYRLGWLYGWALRRLEGADIEKALQKLDKNAYEREMKQGKNPDKVLSAHQFREAMAWGAGARSATGVNAPYSKEYKDAKWEDVETGKYSPIG